MGGLHKALVSAFDGEGGGRGKEEVNLDVGGTFVTAGAKIELKRCWVCK